MNDDNGEMDLEIRHLKLVREVSAAGSLTRAGRRCISPSRRSAISCATSSRASARRCSCASASA